jgi:mannose-6-phosphate isomerase-like protein (cupin superfamily)
MGKTAILELNRRNFLRNATVAAAAGLTLGDAKLFAAPAEGQSTPATPDSFKLYTAEHLAEEWQALEKAPANKTIVINGNYSIISTVEKAKSAKEFEWHEGRDHVIQIVEGTTDYDIGGTPKGGHSTGPGEWLAPESEGATKMTLKKGDMLLVPRGTPHKRSTSDSVKLTIISSIGAKA